MTSGHREPLDAQQYPSDSVEDLSTTAMLGGDIEPGSLKGGRRLVGQALLYSISAFISLGVFLVCSPFTKRCREHINIGELFMHP